MAAAGKLGDRIVVDSGVVGQPTREGEVLEIVEGSVSVRYRVRWTDGHESTFTPSVGSARIVHAEPHRKANAKPKSAGKTPSVPKPKHAAKRKTAIKARSKKAAPRG